MANGQSQLPDDLTATPLQQSAGLPDDLTATPPTGGDQSPEAVAARHARAANPALAGATEEPRGVVGNLVAGAGKEAAESVKGAARLANKILPEGMQIPVPGEDQDLSLQGTAQHIGGGAEQIAEFGVGGEALKGLEGLAAATKLVAAADASPLIAKTLNLAARNEFLARIITEGGKGAAEGAVLGGAQGAVKGAAEGKAGEEAEGGALGGAVGGGVVGAATEALTPFAQAVAKKFGIGTTAVEDATRGARPAKRNTRFAEDFQRAAPTLDAEAQASKPKTLEDWADTIDDARNRVWQTKVQPVIDQHHAYPLGGIRIADSMRAAIPDAMKKFAPEQAAEVEHFANQFLPGQVFALNVDDAEQALEHMNAELASTGYWSKTPSERAALLKTDGNALKYSAAADAIREELYNTLDQLQPGSDMQGQKKLYGALRNVGNEVRGQVNVVGRQSPISLKEAIGLITGLGTGNPVVAAVPFIDRMANSPERLLARGVQKAARPTEEGAISKGVKAAGSAIQAGAAPAGALTGAAVGRIVFRASDGSVHSIPDNENALAHAKAIDPQLEVIPQQTSTVDQGPPPQNPNNGAKTQSSAPIKDMAGHSIPGMIKQGNIDVNHRPIIWNDDGTPSTIFSATIPIENGHWALVPTIANGRFLTPNGKIPKESDRKAISALEDAAAEHYRQTGEHLGIFNSQDAADRYAERTHAWMPNGGSEKVYLPHYEGESNMPLTRQEYEHALSRK